MNRRNLFLVVNSAAGVFARGETLANVKQLIEAQGWTVVDCLDLSTDRFEKLASGEVDAVAVAGGDGTLMSAIDWLEKQSSPLPLLALPYGTANLLARHIHSDLHVERILLAAQSAEISSLRLGTVNDHLFAVAASIGVSPALVKLREDIRSNDRQGGLTRWVAYIAASWRSLFRGSLSISLQEENDTRRATALYAMCPDNVHGRQLLLHGGRIRTVFDAATGLARIAIPTLQDSAAGWQVETCGFEVTSRRQIPVILDGEPVRLDSPLKIEFGRKSIDVIPT